MPFSQTRGIQTLAYSLQSAPQAIRHARLGRPSRATLHKDMRIFPHDLGLYNALFKKTDLECDAGMAKLGHSDANFGHGGVGNCGKELGIVVYC